MSVKIKILPDDITFDAKSSESVLEAALRNSINLPYGCRNGACGSCKGLVKKGTIKYPDTDLTGITEKEMAGGYALFCQARPQTDLVIQTRVINRINDIPIRKLPCRVIKIDRLNHDVIRLLLKLPSSERLQFMAGQYIDILMPEGKRRSFSLANAPHDDEYLELHIRHYDGGLFSEFAFSHLKEKTLLRIEGPLGTFFLREDSDRPIIMVAGGTGFAPVKSMIEFALEKNIQRDILLYWGARTRADLYLDDLAFDWAGNNKNITYIPVLSDAKTNDNWTGRTGLVHESVLEDQKNLAGFDIYTCGPPPMVHAVRDIFIEYGAFEENIYSDSFEFAPK